MITQVTVKHFKSFDNQPFPLKDHIVLAGPNNSGKTTLLQAIAVWGLALRKWTMRGPTSKAERRSGVPITRKDFTAVPLREMKLLWKNTSVSLRQAEAPDKKTGHPRVIEIMLEGISKEGAWELTFEFRHQSTELIYARPSGKHLNALPKAAADFSIVHVPPFSGIGSDETRLDRPYQDLLIGQGKAGDILRNLLLEVYQQENRSAWEALVQEVEEIFKYRLLPPVYEGRPFILCEYLRGIPSGKGKNGHAQLDIASAGSGFHQVLLLLAFFYARPASVLLLDEPDAHQHVILQKQVYDHLRRIAAQRGCQLIIATHSDVLLDSTSPDMIMSFYDRPHMLMTEAHRDQVREALKRLSATDILLADAEPSTGILYLEGETDFNLLRAWAMAIKHPIADWFTGKPFRHSNQGRHPREAKDHFFALRAIKKNLRSVLLLDGDNRRLPEHEIRADGLEILRWRRYEAESYLVHPAALLRFIEWEAVPEYHRMKGEDFLRGELPPAVFQSPLVDHDFLVNTAASKALLPGLFSAAQVQVPKSEYYLIAEQMKPEEIHPEVIEKLDAIQKAFRL